MGSTPKVELLKKTLDLSLDTNNVNPQDACSVILGVASNQLGKELAWKWFFNSFFSFLFLYSLFLLFYVRFTQNWEIISKKYNEGIFLLSNMVSIVTRYFTNEEKCKEISLFFEDKNVSNISRSIEQSLEIINLNSNWLMRDGKVVEEFLSRYKK